MTSMTSNKPYLLRATWSWISDNGLTPHLLVDATLPQVYVPKEYINNGGIVLNISADATAMLNIANEEITFKASFNQVMQDIFVPIKAVKAIYAQENGQGMIFEEDEDDDESPPPEGPSSPNDSTGDGKPKLTIVK